MAVVFVLVAAALVVLLYRSRDHGERSERRAGPDEIETAERTRAEGATPVGERAGEDEADAELHRGPVRVVAVPARETGPALRDQSIPPPPGTNLVTGIVLDPDGAPLPEARLSVRQNGHRVYHIASDDKGRFEVAAPNGAPFDLALMHKTIRGVLVGVQPATKDVVLRGTRDPYRCEVTIQVVYPDGTPAQGATARVLWPRRAVLTGEQGFAFLDALPPLELSVFATPPLARTDVIRSLRETLHPAGQTHVIVLPESGFLLGRVFTPSGRPAAGVKVVASRAGWMRVVSTDDEGRFSIPVPAAAPGSWSVVVTDRRTGARASLPDWPVNAEVTVHLQRVTSPK